jgi:hypothetical protein
VLGPGRQEERRVQHAEDRNQDEARQQQLGRQLRRHQGSQQEELVGRVQRGIEPAPLLAADHWKAWKER